MQPCCSPRCALLYVREKKFKRDKKEVALREAAERRANRDAKEAIKPIGKRLAEAQAAFNAWIRERDRHLPCISCGRFHEGQWHAGHYRTVGSHPELRFEPLNVHKQCAPCNNHKSGNIVDYRINLIGRIGADGVDWLEGKHEPKRYRVDDVEEIKRKYRAALRDLKKSG